jgi:hypothetical protein
MLQKWDRLSFLSACARASDKDVTNLWFWHREASHRKSEEEFERQKIINDALLGNTGIAPDYLEAARRNSLLNIP